MAQVKLDKSIATFAFGPASKKGIEAATVGSGLTVGEDIKAGDACYIKEADGLVYKSGGSGVTLVSQEGARVHGFALEDSYFSGGGGRQGAITLIRDIDVAYQNTAVAIVPGRAYYLEVLSASKGMLAYDAAAINQPPIAGLNCLAIGIDSKRLRIFASP